MTSQGSQGSVLFSTLPKWRAPWYEFLWSYGTQAVVIAIAIWIPVLHPQILEAPKKELAIQLVPTPVPVNHTPQKQLPPRPVLAKLEPIDPPANALRLPAPVAQPKPKPVEDTVAPEVKITAKKPDALPQSAAPVMPKQGVHTGVLSSGSSAPQTIDRPAEKVQTGGFGDPNGVPAKANPGKQVNIAQAGGFDMPTGPGYGNGTGGANGARGVVASSGFGGGVAVTPVRSSSGGAVKTGAFGSDVPAPPTVQSRPAQQEAAKIIPAEILSRRPFSSPRTRYSQRLGPTPLSL